MRNALWCVVAAALLAMSARGGAAECKTSRDCERIGPLCCSGECRAVTKKRAKAERKAAEQRCAVKDCGPPPKTVSCEAPVVCMGGQCRLGDVRPWDAEAKDHQPDDGKGASRTPAE